MHPLLRHSGALLSAGLGLPLLAVAALLRPAWRAGMGQRFGISGPWDPGRVWVHAASVGEVFAAARLFEPLEKRGFSICASATTPAGREALRAGHPNRVPRFAPIDHPWCTAGALRRAAPKGMVLVETELWPIWIASAARARVPVMVVSGRLSERSLRHYHRLHPLFRSTFSRVVAVGARTKGDADRFCSLGIPEERVEVTGDLKADVPPVSADLAPELKRFLASRRCWVAVSTHPGEEAALFDAHRGALAQGYNGGLVVAPRRLDRVPEVEATARAAGLATTRRSSLSEAHAGATSATLSAGEVLVLDTLGEAPALVPRAELVFVGGSLVPVGGHNVLEPAWAGRALMFGPHVENVIEAAGGLIEAGAAERVADAKALGVALPAALLDPDGLRRRGEAALRVVSAHRGAAERSAALIEGALRRFAPSPAS